MKRGRSSLKSVSFGTIDVKEFSRNIGDIAQICNPGLVSYNLWHKDGDTLSQKLLVPTNSIDIEKISPSPESAKTLDELRECLSKEYTSLAHNQMLLAELKDVLDFDPEDEEVNTVVVGESEFPVDRAITWHDALEKHVHEQHISIGAKETELEKQRVNLIQKSDAEYVLNVRCDGSIESVRTVKGSDDQPLASVPMIERRHIELFYKIDPKKGEEMWTGK